MKASSLLSTILFLGAAMCRAAPADAEQEKLPFRLPADFRSLPVTALVETTKGPFEIKFYRKQAPVSVANFEYISRNGMYSNVEFHRYVPAMLIQGGDPTGTKRGGPKWTLPPEISGDIHHVRGAVGWARLDEKINPERRSNASQFYVTLRPVPGLDGFYTIFGQVIRGMENVDQLRPGDRIISVRFPRRDTQPQTKAAPGSRSDVEPVPEDDE